MRKWLWMLLLVMSFASSAWATDVTPTVRPATLLSAQTAVAPGTAVAISGFNVVAFQLTGIAGDTIQFEVSEDNTNWIIFACFPANGTSAVTTATANGGYQCATGGYQWFRLNKTAGASAVTAFGTMSTLGAGLGRGGSGGGGTSHALLSTTHTDSTAATGVSGDILRFNTTWERLAKGADGTCLTLTAGLPGWGSCAGSTSFSAITGGTNSIPAAMVVGNGSTLTASGTGSITANQLAANPANCSAGSAPEGVSATGAVENCTPYQPSDTDLTAIAALADPNVDRMLFWDDSLGAYTFLAPGTGLAISGTTLNATASQAFSDITGPAPNLGQTLIVGNGSTLSATGTGSITATLATALATNGANCPSGQGAGGVTAQGVSENCTDFVEEPAGTGIIALTAPNTTAARTITGTTNQIAVTDGNGVGANPVISLPATVDLTSKTLKVPNSTTLPATCGLGDSYMDTDATLGQQWYLCTSPNTWTLQGGAGGGGAPTTATYITQTPDATLSNEQALSSLSTGCVTVTTGTGVLSSTGAPCGTSGTVTSVDASGGVETTTGSPITATGTVRSTHLVNAQTGTTYTVLTGDRGKLVTFSNAGAIAVTLPVAGGTFPAGWYVMVQNLGVGAVTITPTTSTIDGDASLTLSTDQGAYLTSDGTNYFTMRGRGLTQEADTFDTVTVRGKLAYANSFANAIRIQENSGATTGFAFYVDPTTGPWFGCYVATIQNACDYYRQLNAGKKLGIKNSTGTVVWEVDEATGGVTAATINVETTGVTVTTTSKINFKLTSCAGTTGTLLLDTNATLAPTANCAPGSTNPTLIMGYADFPDSAGEYQVQDSFRLPGDFTGSIDAQFYWRTTATSGDVIWNTKTMCTSDAEVEDVAWNAVSAVTDTAKGTTLQMNNATITGVTATNCAAGDLMHIKFYRDNSGSDTLAATAQLRNVELTLRRAQ